MAPFWLPKCLPLGILFANKNDHKINLVLGTIWAPFRLPKCLPFGTRFAFKIIQKIYPKSDCSKSRSKIAPRPPVVRLPPVCQKRRVREKTRKLSIFVLGCCFVIFFVFLICLRFYGLCCLIALRSYGLCCFSRSLNCFFCVLFRCFSS